jgi:hypothetical protein
MSKTIQQVSITSIPRSGSSSTSNRAKDLVPRDGSTRRRARMGLEQIGKPARASFVDVLQSGRCEERCEAAKALGEISDPGTAPALTKALEDNEFEVRWLAAKGLVAMNVKGLTSLFQALWERGDEVLLREGAHHVLHDLAKGELRKYLKPVLGALEGVEPAVQVPLAAYRALELMKAAGLV